MTAIQTANPCTPKQRRRALRPMAWIKLVLATRQQRLALKALDAEQLCDLGLTAKQAHEEANLPVWDVPDHWRFK